MYSHTADENVLLLSSRPIGKRVYSKTEGPILENESKEFANHWLVAGDCYCLAVESFHGRAEKDFAGSGYEQFRQCGKVASDSRSDWWQNASDGI